MFQNLIQRLSWRSATITDVQVNLFVKQEVFRSSAWPSIQFAREEPVIYKQNKTFLANLIIYFHFFPALYLNLGKIVFLELLAVNSNDSVQFSFNLDSYTSAKTSQRKYTLNEIIPPLISVS